MASFAKRAFLMTCPDNKILPPEVVCTGWPCPLSLNFYVFKIMVVSRRVTAFVWHMEILSSPFPNH